MSGESILWLLLMVTLTLWVVGLVGGGAGGLIHLLLVVALLILVYNLLIAPRPAP